MAAALNPDEVVRSSKGRENFQRLARLLINRCTVLLLEIADIERKRFRHPALMELLEAAKRQWYHPDTTHLFQMMRREFAFNPLFMGLDAPPASKDDSLKADLARIIYNCNLLYHYTKDDMELSGDKFLDLCRDVSKALVRVAGEISPAKAKKWKNAFGTLLKDPLTEEDKRHEQELHRLDREDSEVKEYPIEIMKPLVKRLEEEAQSLIQKIRGGTQDIKDQPGGKVESTAQEVQHSGQDIKDQLRLKVSGPIPQPEVSLLIFFRSILY